MRWVAIVAVVVAGLVISGVLGGAEAQTSTTPATSTPTRTISVGGSAERPLAQGSDRATGTAAYEAAIAAAIDSARAKADFIANKLGTAIADARNVSEGGGFVDCGDNDYTGVEPDTTGAGSGGFGGVPAAGAPASGRAPAAKPKRKHRRKRKHHAHKSAAASCTVSASVTVTYATAG